MTSKWLPLTHTELLRWKAQQVRVAQDSYEVNNKEEKTMTNNEYEYIIKQQKEIIKQQKELIDSLMNKSNNTSVIQKEYRFDYNPYPVYYPTAHPKISPFTCDATSESYSETTVTSVGYICKAPKGTQCDGKCKDCCYVEGEHYGK